MVDNLILSAIIIIQTIIHYTERRDMLNRFSSSINNKDTKHEVPPKHIPSAHSNVLKRWKSTIPTKAGEE